MILSVLDHPRRGRQGMHPNIHSAMSSVPRGGSDGFCSEPSSLGELGGRASAGSEGERALNREFQHSRTRPPALPDTTSSTPRHDLQHSQTRPVWDCHRTAAPLSSPRQLVSGFGDGVQSCPPVVLPGAIRGRHGEPEHRLMCLKCGPQTLHVCHICLHWGGFGGQCRHIWHTWSVCG